MRDIKTFFHDHIIDFVIVLICLVYIFVDLIYIETSNKTIPEILWDGGIAMLVSYGISQAMGIKGLKSAERNSKTIETDNLLGEKIAAAEPHISVMDKWCEKKTILTLERIRRSILAKAGIRYEDVFDADGNSLSYKVKDTIKEIKQKKEKAILKALAVEITNLTTDWLMSNEINEEDPYNHKKTKGKYMTKRAIIDFLTKILVLIGIGVFTVETFKDFSYAKLIWGALQIATYLFMGVMSYMKAYDFVLDELRGQKIKRINLLNEFLVQCAELEKLAEEKKRKTEEIRKAKERKALEQMLKDNPDYKEGENVYGE